MPNDAELCRIVAKLQVMYSLLISHKICHSKAHPVFYFLYRQREFNLSSKPQNIFNFVRETVGFQKMHFALRSPLCTGRFEASKNLNVNCAQCTCLRDTSQYSFWREVANEFRYKLCVYIRHETNQADFILTRYKLDVLAYYIIFKLNISAPIYYWSVCVCRILNCGIIHVNKLLLMLNDDWYRSFASQLYNIWVAEERIYTTVRLQRTVRELDRKNNNRNNS